MEEARLERIAVKLIYWWVGVEPSLRRALNKLFVCPVKGHRRKFDTYPLRGLCIRCEARPY